MVVCLQLDWTLAEPQYEQIGSFPRLRFRSFKVWKHSEYTDEGYALTTMLV